MKFELLDNLINCKSTIKNIIKNIIIIKQIEFK